MAGGRPKHKETVHVDPTQKVLTLEEVAYLLHAHPSTIYRMIKRKQILMFKIGSGWRIQREAFDKWLTEKEST